MYPSQTCGLGLILHPASTTTLQHTMDPGEFSGRREANAGLGVG